MTDAVKFTETPEGDWIIEGLIMPVGGPINGQDLTGSHFTKSTDYAADWFPDGGRPGLYAHGFDPALGRSVIGREIKSWKDDKGVWLRAQIDKAHAYAAEIKQLLDDKKLSLSSGAVDHLTRIAAKSGEITVWPWVEWSLVPNPANPEALLYQVKSTDAVGHIVEAGAEVPTAIKTEPEQVAATDGMEPVPVAWTHEDAIKALTASLTPQALHDAALASGAVCAGETVKSEPVLAITETEAPVDLAALRAELAPVAMKVVKDRLGI